MAEFQDRLKDLMIENNLNNLQLSKRLNISSTTVNDYFNKEYYPEINISISMSKLFDCSLDFLFGLSDTVEKRYDFKYDKMLTNFVNNVQKLLQRKGMSIATFMKEVGMGEFTFYRWKRGKFPKTSKLVVIARYLDISIDFLLAEVME